MNISPERLAEIRKSIPEQIASELVSVQPIDPRIMEEVFKDPLFNQLLNNFVNRLTGKSK